MVDAIVGQKITQTQAFTKDGIRIPVTLIAASPTSVLLHKTFENDGYDAVQVGFGSRRIKTISKAVLGGLKKAGKDKNPPRFLKEIRIWDKKDDDILPVVGSEIKVGDILKAGDKIQVTGISKGKGFQGGVKRYHFKGGPRTHGQSDRERAPGSIGQTTTPGRVYKGKRMAGRMGSDKVTVKNLEVVSIDTEKNILTIKGLVPGGRNSLLLIKKQ